GSEFKYQYLYPDACDARLPCPCDQLLHHGFPRGLSPCQSIDRSAGKRLGYTLYVGVPGGGRCTDCPWFCGVYPHSHPETVTTYVSCVCLTRLPSYDSFY